MGAKKRKTAAVTTATERSKAESAAEPKSKKAKTSGTYCYIFHDFILIRNWPKVDFIFIQNFDPVLR